MEGQKSEEREDWKEENRKKGEETRKIPDLRFSRAITMKIIVPVGFYAVSSGRELPTFLEHVLVYLEVEDPNVNTTVMHQRSTRLHAVMSPGSSKKERKKKRE
jgi:hypothetical protein